MSEFLGQMMGSVAQILGVAQGAAGGALTPLIAQLENAGLAEKVRSWISHGENLPITPEELEAAFTPEQLDAWAEQAGTTPEALLKVMADALPHVIDHATPEGKLPG
ncbi:YidB family protein [Limobrevibacterium gyesilva]|uniref:YidB family protein n=1 Tax=Limobrevibacterium gyesilva TaxID=2991712 RepID=A0AA42CDL0_9PROT|nr:YidB family protein [Limobrevibacterium gyesilva]MCW3474993.1 YidB family protein [Limobrevibacterium gyesilva]